MKQFLCRSLIVFYKEDIQPMLEECSGSLWRALAIKSWPGMNSVEITTRLMEAFLLVCLYAFIAFLSVSIFFAIPYGIYSAIHCLFDSQCYFEWKGDRF